MQRGSLHRDIYLDLFLALRNQSCLTSTSAVRNLRSGAKWNDHPKQKSFKSGEKNRKIWFPKILKDTQITSASLQADRTLELCSPAQVTSEDYAKAKQAHLSKTCSSFSARQKIINRNSTEAKISPPFLIILNCCCNSNIQVGTVDICALSSTQEPSGFF